MCFIDNDGNEKQRFARSSFIREARQGAQIHIKNGLLWVCSHTESLTAEGVLPCQRKKKNPSSCFGLCDWEGWLWERKPVFTHSLRVIYCTCQASVNGGSCLPVPHLASPALQGRESTTCQTCSKCELNGPRRLACSSRERGAVAPDTLWVRGAQCLVSMGQAQDGTDRPRIGCRG